MSAPEPAEKAGPIARKEGHSVVRILRRDGGYNIIRKGVRRDRIGHDLYHRLVTLEWRWLIAYITVIYLGVNSVFACVYLALGDAIENARPGSFSDAFFFSVQTMATIGYGKLVPKGLGGNLLVTLESVFGMASVAVWTGLLFAKFSRPTARVVFSRVAVITKVDDKPVFLFRVANERDSMIVEASMRLVLARSETTREGRPMRRFYDLTLARSETPIFPLSWTVTHLIDDKSPLHGASPESLASQDFEIICALGGMEESFSQPIHARFSYATTDIRFGQRFVDIVSRQPDGRQMVDYTNFHETEPDGLTHVW